MSSLNVRNVRFGELVSHHYKGLPNFPIYLNHMGADFPTETFF